MTMRMRAPLEAEAEAKKETCPVCGAVGDCDPAWQSARGDIRAERVARVFNGVAMKTPLHVRRLMRKVVARDGG